jgi:hypothetical protein
VKFESAPYIMGQIQQRQAIERGETVAKLQATIDGYLSKPDGTGPFPAVVYLHGCNGLSENTRHRIADLMTGWGLCLVGSEWLYHAWHQGSLSPIHAATASRCVGGAVLSVQSQLRRPEGSSQGGIIALRLASTNDIKVFDVPDT